LFPGTPSYDLIHLGVPNTYYGWERERGIAHEMNSNDINEVYLEKRRLASLRIDEINNVIIYSIASTRRTTAYHNPLMDTDIVYCLEHSDPENRIFHDSIQEYAHINEMPVEEAYKQLKIRSENYRSERMRIHAFADYFTNKINGIYSEEDLKRVKAEINMKIRKDLFLDAFFGDESE
jgi:hypothetical protein